MQTQAQTQTRLPISVQLWMEMYENLTTMELVRRIREIKDSCDTSKEVSQLRALELLIEQRRN